MSNTNHTNAVLYFECEQLKLKTKELSEKNARLIGTLAFCFVSLIDHHASKEVSRIAVAEMILEAMERAGLQGLDGLRKMMDRPPLQWGRTSQPS